jgi:hypothetical protein
MKIAINVCHGGFDLSTEGLELYKKNANVPNHLKLLAWDIPRNDENLIAVIEELHCESWGKFSELKVVEIPDDVEWEVGDYDGCEWVAEKHRKWS